MSPVRLACAVVLLALLAGCFGGDDTKTPTPSTPTVPTAPVVVAKPPVQTTDTLHLLEAPAMATRLPAGGSDVRTPVIRDGPGGGDNEPTSRWTYNLTAGQNITGATVTIWIEVIDPLLHFGANPLQPECTWQLTLKVGVGGAESIGCVTEPVGPIAAGIKKLDYTIETGNVPLVANETITVTFDRAAFSPSPNNSVNVLSGSSDHDSFVQITGLKEPQ